MRVWLNVTMICCTSPFLSPGQVKTPEFTARPGISPGIIGIEITVKNVLPPAELSCMMGISEGSQDPVNCDKIGDPHLVVNDSFLPSDIPDSKPDPDILYTTYLALTPGHFRSPEFVRNKGLNVIDFQILGRLATAATKHVKYSLEVDQRSSVFSEFKGLTCLSAPWLLLWTLTGQYGVMARSLPRERITRPRVAVRLQGTTALSTIAGALHPLRETLAFLRGVKARNSLSRLTSRRTALN